MNFWWRRQAFAKRFQHYLLDNLIGNGKKFLLIVGETKME